MKKTRYRGKAALVLFLVVLSFVGLTNTFPVKASDVYKITVKTYYLYVDYETYDSGENGEFRFQCSYESDHSPLYSSNIWSLPSYSSRSYQEVIDVEWLPWYDNVYLRLIEYDYGPYDVVINWHSKSVSSLHNGNNIITYYDGTGLICKFLVIKEDFGIG
ncbi:MAG: hypothetical protein ACFFFG_02285 [Candidatus Thorarchaeota archaeon]